MPKPEKVATVAEIAERFRSSQGAVLTEYRGLTVAQLTQLRKSIGGHATYAVVKNTLTALAAAQAGVTAFDGQLSGPTAVAFVTGDPVEAAKGLRDFARAHPALVIKAGLLEGKALSADEVRQLADLESREVLLAQLAGAMKASLTNAVSLFAAPLSQAARTIDALRQKVEAAVGALPTDEAPTDEAPIGEAPTDEAPTDEAPIGEASTGEAPTDEAPTGEAPTDEAPIGEASTGEASTDEG